MIYVRFAVVLGWMAAVWLNGLPAHGAEFTLSVVGVDSQRRPTLSLTGLTTGRYVLEASTNLNQWFSVTSAPAGIGPLSFVHNEAAQLGTVFYRGLQLPDVSAVVSQVDSNRVAVGLITMESGGSLVLTNESGVRYTFTVGPVTGGADGTQFGRLGKGPHHLPQGGMKKAGGFLHRPSVGWLFLATVPRFDPSF